MANQGTFDFIVVICLGLGQGHRCTQQYNYCKIYVTSFAQIFLFKVLDGSLCNLHVPYPAVSANFFKLAAQTSALRAVKVSYGSPAYYNPPELESEHSTWP